MLGRIAKTNLSSFFGAAYRTEPVVLLYTHADGHQDVLCRVVVEPVVWGDEASMDLWEDATRRPDEDGGGAGDHKLGLIDKVLMAVVELVYATDQPVTRDMVHERMERTVHRRDWQKVDERLRLAAFKYKVDITAGAQNKAMYQRLT
jgi:hypothetical protein